MSRTIIEGLATTEEFAELFDDNSVIQAMLDFETGLARAQALCGVIPQEAADAIGAAAVAEAFDSHDLAREGRKQATIAIPLVKALRESVHGRHPASASFVHWGATSQDVTDTALVILLRQARAILAADHHRLATVLRKLSDQHAGTVMPGRTLLQSAPPVTFGLKAAGWFGAVQRNWARLDTAFREAIVLQFGGASGTLAALGDRGIEVARMLGEELRLTVPDAPWHGYRDRIAAVVTNAGIYTGTLGKIARDAALLMQQEVGEVAEPGGGSSTMPQKRNPAAFTVVLACANRVPGLVANFLNGMVQEQERGVGGLQAEWPTVAGVMESTGAGVSSLAGAMESLKVYPERMRDNIAATRGLIFSERVMMLVAGRMGRERAHRLLAEASRAAVEEKLTLGDVIRRTPEIAELLTPEQMAGLDAPEQYLGAAEIFRRQLLKS